MSKCGAVYPTGDPQAPAKRCSKRPTRGPGSACSEHGRQLALYEEPGREAVKARYGELVAAFEEMEDLTKRAGSDPAAAKEVPNARARLRRAARGRQP